MENHTKITFRNGKNWLTEGIYIERTRMLDKTTRNNSPLFLKILRSKRKNRQFFWQEPPKQNRVAIVPCLLHPDMIILIITLISLIWISTWTKNILLSSRRNEPYMSLLSALPLQSAQMGRCLNPSFILTFSSVIWQGFCPKLLRSFHAAFLSIVRQS